MAMTEAPRRRTLRDALKFKPTRNSRALAVVLLAGVLVVAVIGANGNSKKPPAVAAGRPAMGRDQSLGAYVVQHQSWIPLAPFGIQKFTDAKPADTAYLVYTTIPFPRSGIENHETHLVCQAIVRDLRTLGLPQAVTILDSPEVLAAQYPPSTTTFC